MQKGVVTISVEGRGGVGYEFHKTCLGTHVGYFLLCLQSLAQSLTCARYELSA